MPPPPGKPAFALKPRIRFTSELLLPAALYGIRLPQGLAADMVPVPEFVTPPQMVALLRSSGHGHGRSGLGITHGLTVAEFAFRFADPGKQWRQVPQPKGRPAWQFQGGDAFLDLALTIYVLEGDRPPPDDQLAVEIFALIMGHELLHVLDDVDIIKTWLPPRAAADDYVLRFLAQGELMDDATYQAMIAQDGMTDRIWNLLWAPERNRRAGIRDARTEYAKLQEEIDARRIKIINRP